MYLPLSNTTNARMCSDDNAGSRAAQDRDADREIAAGRHREFSMESLGVPKNIISKAGYPTTWGALPFKDRIIDEDATWSGDLRKPAQCCRLNSQLES